MRIKNKNDWCFRFFNSPDYLDIYQDMTDKERTQKELAFCEKVLKWKPGQWILDAPCGAGRHTLLLSRHDHHIVGLDFSTYLLSQAQKGIPQCMVRGTKPHFIQGMLQNLPLCSNTFDYIICLFSSYGYGETEEENLQVMKEFYRVLRPGGKILIDVMNRNFIVPRMSAVYESIQADLYVREERTFSNHGRRLHNCIQVQDKEGNKRQYFYRPWLFNGWELSWIAIQAGMKVVAIYGNFLAETYQEYSERAMIVAEKSDSISS